MHAGRALLKLASYVCDVLPELVKHKTRTRSAWVAQTSILLLVIPLLRV
jgi:hypothetical protein